MIHLFDRLAGVYATSVYLPFSALSRRLRLASKAERTHLQPTRLPSVSWRNIIKPGQIRLLETRKCNGNVRLSELGVLAQLAHNCRKGGTLFEIGTFDGRTTLNLATNAPRGCKVVTLDLPDNGETKFALDKGERRFTRKAVSGERYRRYVGRDTAMAEIEQLLGDSACFDAGRYRRSCTLVFVDGSHAYDYVLSDSSLARELIEPGGVIVWHEYGVWRGVTKGLEELAAGWHAPLLHVRGTSLVVLRTSPEAVMSTKQ